MKEIIIPAQITIAIVLLNVWIFRYEQMKKEFNHYKLPDWLRIFTCVSKVTIALLLIAGVWYQNLTLISTQVLGLFMIFALMTHAKVKNPPLKYAPALSVLLLCVFINLATN